MSQAAVALIRISTLDQLERAVQQNIIEQGLVLFVFQSSKFIIIFNVDELYSSSPVKHFI